jgi:GTPase SAR1 family protein
MIQNQNYDYLFKFILMGDAGVGKTSILQRYTERIFN